MATSLLLEGDNLEELLIRARQEGGPQARIVRAEKVRQGGVLGFFARESYEVAIEVPDDLPADPIDEPAVPDPSSSPAEILLQRRINRFLDSADLAVDEQSEPVEEAQDFAPDQADAGPEAAATSFAPFGEVFEAARNAFGAQVASVLGQARAAQDGAAAEPLDEPDDESAESADESAESAAAEPASEVEPEPEPEPEPQPEPEPAGPSAVLAAEREVSRSVAGQPLSAPTAEAFRVPQRRGPLDAERVPLDAGQERELAAIAHSAAQAAVYAAVHAAGGGRPDSPSHSAERGMAGTSGHWRFVPTHSPMVTGFPGTQSHTDEPADSREHGVRPEFTALLEQLRRRAGAASETFDTTLGDNTLGDNTFGDNAFGDNEFGDTTFGWSQSPWHDDVAVLEPLATEAAWAVVEQVDPQVEAPADDEVMVDELPAPAPAIPMPRRGQASKGTQNLDGARLAADRAVLRRLGLPPAWIRRLRGGDRYADVWQALEPLPEVDIDPQTLVIAVVGPAESVRLEAHRVAVDLAIGDLPRPVIDIPAAAGAERAGALHDATRLGACVVAVETGPDNDPALVVESVTTIGAGVVIVIVEAGDDLGSTQARLDALGSIDAIAVEGVALAAAPMQLLQLGVPITRLDGVPIDRMTWTALLCAQLEAAAPALS